MNSTTHLDSPGQRRFRFPLPVDPIRLVAGVLSRWPLIVICMMAFAAAGAVVGKWMTKPSYALSVSLLKRKVPQSMQTGEIGQSYRPADLNDPTLLATLLAEEPLEKASARANNGLESSSLRKRVEAAQQKGTDIYFITYHSPVSAHDAVDFIGIWAEEINNYTRRLQQSDARGVREILQTEVTDLERQLETVNRQILDFSREKQFLGTQTQVLAALNQLGQATLELENAKSALVAKESQIKSLTEELQRQSPVESQLKSAREEVANLRQTYTDENPLVKAKLQGIEFLQTTLNEAREKGPGDLESYTGTPIGNQLFLDILAYRNELTALRGKVESYTRLNATLQKRVDEFPAIVSRYEELQKLRESLLSSHSLLSNRLKETEIFASGSPGYWQIFQGPQLKDVVADSMIKKPAILGLGGGVTGAFIGILLILIATTRSRSRSALECCLATGAPLLVEFTSGQTGNSPFRDLWVQTLADRFSSGEIILFWTATASPEDEREFWKRLQEAAFQDGGRLPAIADLTPDDLWSSGLPGNLVWGPPSTIPGKPLILRSSGLPSAAGRLPLKQCNAWFCLASGHADRLEKANRPDELLSQVIGPCEGTVAAIGIPTNAVRRRADQFSSMIAHHFSRPIHHVPTHE